MRTSLTALTARGLQSLVVSGGEAATVADVTAALRRTLGVPAGGLWAGGRPLDPRTLARAALRDGDVIAFNPTAATATVRGQEPQGLFEVRVSGGPSAGEVHPLSPGLATLGSGRWCTITVEDATAPDCVAEIRAEAPGRIVVAPMADGVTLDGRPLYEPEPWPYGGVLKAGLSVLTLHPPGPPDAHVTPLPEGGLAYNRPPRLDGPVTVRTVEVPIRPPGPEHHRLQLLSSLVFGIGGIVLAFVMDTPWFLLMTLLTPASLIAQWWSDKRYGKKQHRQAMKDYRRRRAEFDTHLEELRRADEAGRRAEFPDPAATMLAAVGPRQRLWERRLHDADTLHLRVGVTDLPAKIELVPERNASGSDDLPPVPVSHAVPIVVPLPQAGVMGVTGDRPPARSLARWLVAQAAALHSPRDLSIVVLSADHEGEANWSWARWLPHCAPRDGEECLALVGNDPETVARRVAELMAKIGARRERQAQLGLGGAFASGTFAAGGYAGAQPYNVLVVLDGARALRGLPGVPQLLQLGPTVGVYSICVDDDQRLLPEECTAVAVCESPGTVRLRGGPAEHAAPAIADLVSPRWCDRAARAMAPLRDIGGQDAEAAIPDSARLLDLLGMPDPGPGLIAERWRRDGRATRVPIGVGADGPYTVDLKVDGPHGLIAGTTGAGKSELLQSLIASLAVANRPDEMTFVLIDYKGGSAFKDCAKLPHTVGMVSDLDGHLTERALESLAAELRRREHLLLRAGTKDIEDHNELRDLPQGRTLEAMPRLLLVIDEFAAMVAELPDFITGLVDIARRGRSLGVHLILATQRPGGVVTPDIAANTNLRIALRVTSGDESADVIDSAGAAAISKATPGRCYVRSGAASLHLVQSARIGGRRPREGPAVGEPVRVEPVGWQRLGLPLPAPAETSEDDGGMVTDLAILVDAIAEAARGLGIERQRSPWLPPLPKTVMLDDLPVPAAGRSGVSPLPFALADLPARQVRRVEHYDLETAGHLLVIGAGRTGRSSVLRALAASAGRLTDPADVHIYGVDCGNKALLPLVGMPHTGAVVGRESPDRLGRLTNRLLDEIAARQQSLAAQGFADVTEQRAVAPPGQRLPYLLVLFDRWEGFTAAFDTYDQGVLIDQWLQILQEGAGAGVKVVVTGDRSTLIGRVSTQFDDRLVLKLTDSSDYSYLGLKARDVPEDLPPGRAFRAASGLREVQVALLDADPAGSAQVAALHEVARRAGQRHAGQPRARRPFRVDALPGQIDLAGTLALAEVPPPDDAVVVGVAGDTLGERYFRAAEHGPALVVAGTPKSGRSTALATMLAYLVKRGWQPAIVAPRASPLRGLGVPATFGADATPDQVRAALRGRHVLVVDDLELLGTDSELAYWLTEHVGEIRDSGNLVIAAGSADDLDSMYSGPIVAMKKSRSGLLLRPNSVGQGDLFGITLPRSAATGMAPAGRGLLVRGGSWEQIQVATP
ncbi:FtsK/SpoIIIE domain-containing protein [Nonomuraea antimicrobica]|uniref:FtsK/SpoIIIE domain-containing protein n=1 Tax=Nonomuraea antimicrobica TaxID=561173 RepID=A0ABP7BFZ5_9ACTN